MLEVERGKCYAGNQEDAGEGEKNEVEAEYEDGGEEDKKEVLAMMGKGESEDEGEGDNTK